MKTGIAITMGLFVLGMISLPVAIAKDDELLAKAKTLYEQKDYLSSVAILENLKDKSAEALYWLWRNEEEIGGLAGPYSRDQSSPNFKYYEYVTNHPEYLEYDEAAGGSYIPTNKRYEEITQKFPNSEYAGTMLFELIKYNYPEDMMNQEDFVALISNYQGFVNQYSKHPKVGEAKQEIETLEENLDKHLHGRFEEGELIIGGESILSAYDTRFTIDPNTYTKYVEEWIKSGPYREFGINVLGSSGRKGKLKVDILAPFDLPDETKKKIRTSIEDGKLVMFSEAAYKSKDWQGPKFLVFDPQTRPSNR